MPGNWVTDHMPHLREILDCLSDASAVKRVVLAFCAQMGKTEVGLNWIGYVIDHNPRPMLVVLPTLEVRKRWVLQRLDPLITETPCLVEIFGQQTRDAANSQDVKDFPGGLLVLGGANSPASLASMPICYVLCDEVDRFPWEVGKEGDPLGLIDERTKTFPRRKALLVSTPTIKDASRIWEEFLNSDQRYRHVSCPHCGEMQVLKWGNLRWEKDAKTGRVTHAYYVCEHSGCIIEETAKVSMLPRAQWIPHNPGHDVRGYHINGLYAPIGLGFSWLELAQQWLDAQGDDAKLKRFINTALGEPWENRKVVSDSHELKARAEPYTLRSIPDGVLRITAGFDTQDNRIAMHIIGWGKGRKWWTLDYIEIPGSPARDEVWAAIEKLIATPLYTRSGKELHIEATAGDTGGHFTYDVYAFARTAQVPHAMAIKGSSIPSKPALGKPSYLDFNWRGKTYKRGVQLWTIGTDTIKHILFGLLSSDQEVEASERRCHFSTDLELSYYDGLLSEVFDPEKNKYVKRRGRRRNEVLDTWVYAYAASCHPELRIPLMKDKDWDALEEMINTPVPEFKETPQSPASVTVGNVASSTQDDDDDLFTAISLE
jgi:phage terminase large subunit GpA-like protein